MFVFVVLVFYVAICMCLATHSDRVGKVLCEKCLFLNGTRSYSHINFNHSDFVMWARRTTQSDIEISDRLVYIVCLFKGDSGKLEQCGVLVQLQVFHYALLLR